jgi:MFS family permease
MSNSILTFDEILNKKIGFGKYQYLSFIILGLVDLTDGVELLTMSVLMSILKNQWNISDFKIELMTSLFYLGMFLGAIITGKIADKYGRRLTIIVASFLQFLTSLSFAYINSPSQLMILRFIYGFCYGFSLPLTISTIAEITPLKYRGKMIICVNFCVTLGKLYGLFIIYLTLEDFRNGNWRKMMTISAISSFFVCIGILIFLKESPRYLIATGQINECVQVLDYIGEINNPLNYTKINDRETKDLLFYHKKIFDLNDRSNHHALFSNDLIGTTLRLWMIWFSLIFIEFGQYAILPFIFGGNKLGFASYIYTIMGELPSIFFSFYFIDKINYGRKNTLSICLIALGVLNFLIFIFPIYYMGVLLGIQRFFMKSSFNMLIPLSTEVYPTLYRTIGYGWASASGRCAAFIAPFVLFYLFRIGNLLPFFAFALISFLGFFASNSIKIETSSLNLDEKQISLINNENYIENDLENNKVKKIKVYENRNQDKELDDFNRK